MSPTVADILKRKGDWVITTVPAVTVFKAIERMVEHNVGAIVVADRGRVLGIFTERDYLRRVTLQGRSAKETQVSEVMTSDVLCVGPEETIEECLAIMTAKKCRHLPVLRGEHLSGIISIGDCVRELSEVAAWRLERLEQYVAGQYPG